MKEKLMSHLDLSEATLSQICSPYLFQRLRVVQQVLAVSWLVEVITFQQKIIWKAFYLIICARLTSVFVSKWKLRSSLWWTLRLQKLLGSQKKGVAGAHWHLHSWKDGFELCLWFGCRWSTEPLILIGTILPGCVEACGTQLLPIYCAVYVFGAISLPFVVSMVMHCNWAQVLHA